MEVNSLNCKSCGSEAKCVNALILNFSRILSQTEGKKEELRNQVLSFLQKTQNNSMFCGQVMPRGQANLQS